ncbi:MAG: hypothetical protein ACO307_12320, partial [Ilumatobacteraceae bacterium]
PALQQMFHGDQPALALANPIAADLSTMRLSLWPGLAQALRENQRRQQARVRLFECGSKFVVSDGQLSEVAVIAAIAGGADLPEQWGADDRPCDFFDLRADLDPSTVIVTGGERIKRGHTNGPIRVALPDGYLDHLDDEDFVVPDDADAMALSGG